MMSGLAPNFVQQLRAMNVKDVDDHSRHDIFLNLDVIQENMLL